MRSDVPHMQQSRSSPKTWVDPCSLPNHGDISTIGGNASDYVKQLNLNTYMSYGVGNEDTFGYKVGKSVRFVDISIERNEGKKGKLEASTIAELIVTKGMWLLGRYTDQSGEFICLDMLNGAGMLHGGCVAYLIDKWALNHRAIHESDSWHSCCSTPLVVLGLIKRVNGVGVTQSMSIFFHAPASMWASSTERRPFSLTIMIAGLLCVLWVLQSPWVEEWWVPDARWDFALSIMYMNHPDDLDYRSRQRSDNCFSFLEQDAASQIMIL